MNLGPQSSVWRRQECALAAFAGMMVTSTGGGISPPTRLRPGNRRIAVVAIGGPAFS